MNAIAIFVIGILLGCVIMASIYHIKSAGRLRVLHDEDGPLLFLELKKNVNEINRRYVILEVTRD